MMRYALTVSQKAKYRSQAQFLRILRTPSAPHSSKSRKPLFWTFYKTVSSKHLTHASKFGINHSWQIMMLLSPIF